MRPLLNYVEKHFMGMGAPSSMLMVEQHHGPDSLDSTIWIRLPDKGHMAGYPGFEEVPEDQLPRKAILLIGDGDEFAKLFEYGSDYN